MKIRKITAAFSAAALLTAALPLTAQAIETKNYDNISFDSWQAAYHVVLSDFFGSEEFDFTDKDLTSGSRFELYDIDHDRVPELFVSQNGGRSGRCVVYSFYNNKLSQPVVLGTYGNAFADPNAHYLVNYDRHMGEVSLTYFKLEKGVFTKEISFNDNSELKEMGETNIVYMIDGKEVSETKYVQEKEKYDHMELIAHGRKTQLDAMDTEKDNVIYSFFLDHYTALGASTNQKDLSLTIADSIGDVPVTEIEQNAFKGSENLVSVTIGKNIRDVKNSAFENCTNLKTVKFTGDPGRIGPRAFAGCTSLEAFTGMDSSNIYKTYKIVDGVIYRTDMGDLAVYPSGKKNTFFSIPNGIQAIEPNAFTGNAYIENIVCPEWVNTICEGAFAECPALKEVSVYNGEARIINEKTECTVCNSYDPKVPLNTYKGVIMAYMDSTAYKWADNRALRIVLLTGSYIKETGDVTRDSKIDAVDASHILAEYSRTSTNKEPEMDFAQRRAGDIDKNGTVDAVDASKVLSYYAFISSNKNNNELTIEQFLSMAQ
ncbi:leucine-rich repeat protein [Ruminococcus flavefaciens]|uniref:leucine-rich repeat protein n=1 Tax=Ruminococcus flavefaciens TaxID=1265 RepID=UPI0013DBE32A|nr:leucine-rich repeat protein [Ruminococcus flavefaciens]